MFFKPKVGLLHTRLETKKMILLLLRGNVMKSKTEHVEGLDKYHSIERENSNSIEEKRLDLNVLLKRLENQKNDDFKVKVLVTVGAVVLFLTVLTILNF